VLRDFTSQRSKLRLWAGPLLLLAGALLFSLRVVQDYSGPLVSGGDWDGQFRGDGNYFEFLGYYVRDHYHFGSSPISFVTDEVAFPYGTHIGLLSWCAERDLFHAAMLKLFGSGAWLQVYCTLSSFVGAFGMLLVLRKEYGVLRASLAGFASTYMNFYAWYKFPYHINMCAVHWVVLSLASDAVWLRKVTRGDRPSLFDWVLKGALVLLSMGLDLGYVAGHALMSVAVTGGYAWAYLGTKDDRIFRRLRFLLPAAPKEEIRRAPWALAAVALFALFGATVYVPFVFAIVRDSKAYPMTDAGGTFWASPFHVLFPYFPWVHPASKVVKSVFGTDEGIGEFTPGFTLIFAAAVGLRRALQRKSVAALKPLLIMLVLVLAFHPTWSKTLQVFPWFAYHRVAGRATIVLPVLLALIGASSAHWSKWQLRALCGLGVVEVLTAAFLVNEYKPAKLTQAHRAYFATVAAMPGKGLLEWPFCIAAGNTVMTRELCPYYDKLATAYANRRFHEKATVSVYLSRIHPLQFKTWLDEGWPQMFMPDDPKREHPTRELRCFSELQWQRFDTLFRSFDFAGLQIYTSLLPAGCVQEFHHRYGEPVASETLPRVGPVQLFRPPH
jgi:hypothetical protein